MATIKLPKRQLMNQNVTPAKLEANNAIGDAYKAVGEAARSLGANIRKDSDERNEQAANSWVLKAMRQSTDAISESTIANREKMDKITGKQKIVGKDGTVTVGEELHVDAQKKARTDIDELLKKDAPSEHAFYLYQKKSAPGLLAGIMGDDNYVKSQQTKQYKANLETTQDHDINNVYTHDPESTGVSNLKNSSNLIDKAKDDLLGQAQVSFMDDTYETLWKRGPGGIAKAFFNKTISQKNWGEGMMGGNFLIGPYQKDTLTHLERNVRKQLGGQKLKVEEKEGRVSVISTDGTLQYNMNTNQMEPYDGTASMEPAKNGMFDFLPQQEKFNTYKRLMTEMAKAGKEHKGVITTSLNNLEAKTLNFNHGSRWRVGDEKYLAEAEEIRGLIDKQVDMPDKQKAELHDRLDVMAIAGATIDNVAMQDPTTAKNNIMNAINQGSAVGGKNRERISNYLITQYGKMRESLRKDGANYIINNDVDAAKKYEALTTLTSNPNADPAEKQKAIEDWGTYMEEKYEGLQVPKSERKTMPDSFTKPYFDAADNLMDKMSDNITQDGMLKVYEALNKIYDHVPRNEGVRLMNEYGSKNIKDPRLYLAAKIPDPLAAADVLAAIAFDKKNPGAWESVSTKKKKDLMAEKYKTGGDRVTSHHLEAILSSQGGGKGAELQESYGKLLNTYGQYLMIYGGDNMKAKDAMKTAATTIFGDYHVAKYAGATGESWVAVSKQTMKDKAWTEKDIGKATKYSQNPQFLTENVDWETSFPFIKNDIEQIAKNPKFKGQNPEYIRDLIKMKYVNSMLKVNLKDKNGWAYKKAVQLSTKYGRSGVQGASDYSSIEMPNLGFPTIHSKYMESSEIFAPVYKDKRGTVRRLVPNIHQGGDYTKYNRGAADKEGFLGVSMEEVNQGHYNVSGRSDSGELANEPVISKQNKKGVFN